MSRTLQQLWDEAHVIRTETEDKENSADRVGGLLEGIVEYLGDFSSSDLNYFLDKLNRTSILNSGDPGSGSTIIFDNGAWGFGDAGGGTPSFPVGSILESLWNSRNTSPGTLSSGKIIKYNGTAWEYADDGGQGTGDFTKSIFENSKWWGAGYKRITEQGQVVGYRIKGNIIGIKEQGDPNDIPLLDYIQFSNGVKLGVDSTDTIKVYKTVPGTEPDTTVDTGVAHFYATGGVSALGNSSGGGGGGGGDTLNALLADLNDDVINSSFPGTVNNKALMYGDEGQSGGTGHWYWGDISSGAVLSGWADFFNGKTKDPLVTTGFLYVSGDSVTLAAGTSGISAIQVGGYNFALAGDSINLVAGTNVTLTPNTNTTPKTLTISASGGGGGGGGTSSVTINGNSTGDYWAPTTAGTSGYILTSGGSGTAPTWSSFSSLLGQRTLWGNTDSFGDIGSSASNKHSLNYVDSITMYGNITMLSTNTSEGAEIIMGGGSGDIHLDNYKDANNNSADALSFRIFTEGAGNCNFEYYPLQGGAIIGPGHTGSYLQIGSVKIIEESGNTLKIECANGNAGHLYATGGISALGLSSGSSPSIGNLTVTDTLSFTNGFTEKIRRTQSYPDRDNLNFTIGSGGVISFGDNPDGTLINGSGQLYMGADIFLGNRKIWMDGTPSSYLHIDQDANTGRYILKFYDGSQDHALTTIS